MTDEIAIYPGQIFPSSTAAPIDGGGLLIRGGLIAAVGTRDEIESLTRPEAQVYEFPTSTAMPGLIDCHVHLSFDSGGDPLAAVASADPEALATDMARRARELVKAGVTTARDLGDRDALTVALRDAIAAGELDGPRLLAATTPLTCVGGHCAFLGGEVTTDEEIRERIAANVRAGADLIKVMASGGALTPGGPRMWEAQFEARQLRYIVERATSQGMPVAAHAHGTQTIADCVDAGVNTIEHCSWRTETNLVYDPDVVERMVRQQVAVCRCVSGDWRLFLTQLGKNAEPLIESIQRMRAAGVRFIAGTDAGVPGARFDDYPHMLGFFQEIGFTNSEIIGMATSDAADALGLRTGNLEPGYSADVLVVDGDPLSDLTAIGRPQFVVAGGRVPGSDDG